MIEIVLAFVVGVIIGVVGLTLIAFHFADK